MQTNRLTNLLQLLEQQPDDAFLIYAVGFEYESAGQDIEAESYYLKLLDSHADYLPLYYQYALLKARTGRETEALQLIDKGMMLARDQKNNKTLRELSEAKQMIEEEME